MYYRGIILVLAIVVVSNAIGYQHCTFRSQGTQGAPWTGTTTITNEKFDITVYKEYLDVELEWDLAAGGTAPKEYAEA